MDIEKIYNNNKIRIKNIKGNPFFALIDVCNILDIRNPSDALSRLDKDDLGNTESVDSLGRKQMITMINEGALYQLVFRSRKKESKDFKKWVTHEVLPSIRKTGKYSIPDKIKKLSTENRNILTDSWKECGVEKWYEYVNLTIEEYKQLGFDKGKRKKDMNKEEILLLSAFESMEALNLFYDKKNGYKECKDSLGETAKIINNVKEIK